MKNKFQLLSFSFLDNSFYFKDTFIDVFQRTAQINIESFEFIN